MRTGAAARAESLTSSSPKVFRLSWYMVSMAPELRTADLISFESIVPPCVVRYEAPHT